MKAAVPLTRQKNARRIAADGIQMGSQEDALARLSRRREPRQQVGPVGEDLLKFNFQTVAACNGREKIGHTLFARARIIRRQKGRIDARKRNQLAKQFGRRAQGVSLTGICAPSRRGTT